MTTHYNTVGQLLGRQFMFESENFPNEFWRHKNFELWRDVPDGSKLYQLDASFDIVPGLCGVGISFRSVNYPAHYIRHSGGECFISKASESNDIELFEKDASWIPHEGLADPQGPAVSFESVNYPGEYIRHSSERVRKDQTMLVTSFMRMPPGILSF